LLGAILVLSRYVALAPSNPIPLLNITLANNQYFSRVVAVLLTTAAVYLILEWKLSSKKARDSYWAIIRAGFTILYACVSLWLCYPLIASNTRFEAISPVWYLGFLAIGFFLGIFVSILILASLMIRTPSEAKAVCLPRIPVAVFSQYKAWIPVVIVLLAIYYVLWHFSPEVIKEIGFVFVYVPFLFIIGEEFAWLYLSKDENGNRISYAKRIARFKAAHDIHDYAYFLADHGSKTAEKTGILTKASPQAIQKAMQEHFSSESSAEFRFHVQQQEETQIQFYFKDGDKDNLSTKNRGVRIEKHQGKKGLLAVLVIPDDPDKEQREMEISTILVEKNAEEYLSTHTEGADLTFRKILSYGINQTVIKKMSEQAGPLLQRVVEAGQEDTVKKLLKQEDINVNEQAEYGWTALLYASAQGYPRIARLLLDAGANPDMGNLQGLTPLMYSARYGNIEVCKLMLEYGANPDLQDVYGLTALMVATRLGYADVAKTLLKAGANLAIKDCYSMTALDFAHKFKQGQIAKLLRTAKKNVQAPK